MNKSFEILLNELKKLVEEQERTIECLQKEIKELRENLNAKNSNFILSDTCMKAMSNKEPQEKTKALFNIAISPNSSQDEVEFAIVTLCTLTKFKKTAEYATNMLFEISNTNISENTFNLLYNYAVNINKFDVTNHNIINNLIKSKYCDNETQIELLNFLK